MRESACLRKPEMNCAKQLGLGDCPVILGPVNVKE
jgi:hypothetical protein